MHNQPHQPLAAMQAEIDRLNKQINAKKPVSQARLDLEALLYDWWISDQINLIVVKQAIALLKQQ